MSDGASSYFTSWQWLSVAEVSRHTGLTQERVRQLIRQKKIRATKLGGWMVRPDDLRLFIASRTNVHPDGEGA